MFRKQRQPFMTKPLRVSIRLILKQGLCTRYARLYSGPPCHDKCSLGLNISVQLWKVAGH